MRSHAVSNALKYLNDTVGEPNLCGSGDPTGIVLDLVTEVLRLERELVKAKAEGVPFLAPPEPTPTAELASAMSDLLAELPDPTWHSRSGKEWPFDDYPTEVTVKRAHAALYPATTRGKQD